MALTYLPNANKVELSGDRSATPLIVGVVSLLIVVGLGWAFYSWLSPDVAAVPTTATGPVTIPGGDKPPIPAVYGTQGEFFQAGFNATPLAAADTGRLRVTFPAAATVSGYAIATDPLTVYENVASLQAAGTHMVYTSTLPKGVKYTPALIAASIADLPKPYTEVERFGYQGFTFSGTSQDLFKTTKTMLGTHDTSAAKKYASTVEVPNPEARVEAMFLFSGRHAFLVYGVDADKTTAQAFVDSFHPVADADVTTPPVAAR